MVQDAERAVNVLIRERTDAIAETKSQKRVILELLVRILVLAAFLWLLFSQVFMITQVKGNDMFPAVKAGDLVLAFRLEKNYAKNDVVVYQLDGKNRVGRVAARGGDTLVMDDSGTILVNGTRQSGQILYPTYAKSGIDYPYHVPNGQVFLLGDYRTQTEDSRDFGSIAQENVKGKVITILRRQGL